MIKTKMNKNHNYFDSIDNNNNIQLKVKNDYNVA